MNFTPCASPARRPARRTPLAAALATAGSLAAASPAFAAEDPSAGGAAMDQVIIASAAVGAVFTILILIALANRAGRVKWLNKAADFASFGTGLPRWAALPSAVLVISLVSAVFGLYWDISLHLSQGRDEGPLANPSHYFILVGLLGSFSAGVLACTMVKPGVKPSPFAVKFAHDWHAPLGGVLIAASAAFGLIGFPLDDVWHRLFGQDVTLWGPTHLLMLAGASLTLIGQAILLVEGVRANETNGIATRMGPRRTAVANRVRRGCAAGGILVALSIYQGEFDFGIPQFQLVFQPIMLMVAAGIALTLGRVWAGKGGALIAVALFIVVRGALTLIVTGIFDRPVAHFPIYLGSALAVEAVGLLMAGSVTRSPMKFALAAGAAIGTVGLAWEWAWSHVWMVFPWPEALWPEGAIAGFIAAMAGATIGVWMGNSLMMRPRVTGAARFAPLVGAVAIMALVGYGLNEQRPSGGITAQVTTQTVETGKPGRWITATAKLDSTYFDDGTKWAQALAWQGPGFENVDLVRIAPGTYKLAEPLPADGKWKTVMRFHAADTIMGLPLYEPRDDAIPAAETPALPSFTRELQPDREVLQRESKVEGGTLPLLGYLLMLTIALTLLALLAWGIWRVGQPDEPGAGSAEGPGASPGSVRKSRRAKRESGGAPATPRAA